MPMVSKQKLVMMYCAKKLSLAKIAEQLGVSTTTVLNWMNKYDIPRRSISEALKGRKLAKKHVAKVKKNIEKANAQRSKNGVSQKERERLYRIAKLRKNFVHSSETKKKMSEVHRGKKMSIETRKKMSEARKNNPKFSGKNHPMYGIERLDMKGKNNPNWNGGITSLYRKIRKMTKYAEWRKSCFVRDQYTCQFCGAKNKTLNVDHIIPFALIVYRNNLQSTYDAQSCNELWNTKNGRTLCEKCHQSTKTYGLPLAKQKSAR